MIVRMDRSRQGGIVAGCLIALGVLVVIGIIGGIWVYMNWRSLAVGAFKPALVQMVEESRIPPDQQKKMIDEIDQVAQDFESGKLSIEEMQRIAEEIGESPLLPIGTVYFVDEQYFGRSGLSEEEKERGRLALNRYARGIYEEKIARNDVERVLDPIADTSGDGVQLHSPDQVADDDLREMVSRARTKADEVEMPEEEWEIDFAAEFSRSLDRALGRTPETQPGAAGGSGAGQESGTPPSDEASGDDTPADGSGEETPTEDPAEEPAEEPAPAGGG